MTVQLRHKLYVAAQYGGVMLFGLALAFGATELLLRCLGSGGAGGWYDRPHFYYNPPGSRSLRGFTHQPDKPEGVFRIAVVGDSYSYAPFMQFDDAFPKRLERLLGLNEAGRKVETINYGIPGLSTTHERFELKRALRERADVVLLQITLNDPEIKPFRPTGIQVRRNPRGALVLEESAGWFSRHSRVIAFIRRRLHNQWSHQDYINYHRALFADPEGMAAFRRGLARIAQSCRARGVTLGAVLFPLFGATIDESYPFTALHQIVHEELQKLGVPYLDLTPEFRGIPIERLQVMPGEDFHPNEIGHRIAAEAIYRWLLQSKLVPAELGTTKLYRERDQLYLKEELKIDRLF